MITLITGGVRSGKSSYALKRAQQQADSAPKCFIATAEALDAETKLRIQNHQKERGPEWTTLEVPVRLAEGLREVPSSCQTVVLDCLTFWVNNLLYYHGENEIIREHEIFEFKQILQSFTQPLFIVTNEVGLGLMPADPLSRRYQDLLGKLNQQVAALADEVVFMTAGIPMTLKGVPYGGLVN